MTFFLLPAGFTSEYISYVHRTNINYWSLHTHPPFALIQSLPVTPAPLQWLKPLHLAYASYRVRYTTRS